MSAASAWISRAIASRSRSASSNHERKSAQAVSSRRAKCRAAASTDRVESWPNVRRIQIGPASQSRKFSPNGTPVNGRLRGHSSPSRQHSPQPSPLRRPWWSCRAVPPTSRPGSEAGRCSPPRPPASKRLRCGENRCRAGRPLCARWPCGSRGARPLVPRERRQQIWQIGFAQRRDRHAGAGGCARARLALRRCAATWQVELQAQAAGEDPRELFVGIRFFATQLVIEMPTRRESCTGAPIRRGYGAGTPNPRRPTPPPRRAGRM